MTEANNIGTDSITDMIVNEQNSDTSEAAQSAKTKQRPPEISEIKYNFLIYQMLVAVSLLILILLFKTFGGSYYETVRAKYISTFDQNLSVTELTKTVKDVFNNLKNGDTTEQNDTSEDIKLEYSNERNVALSDSILNDEMGFEAMGVVVDNSLMWPVNGRISDYFGCRTDPFDGTQISNHKGLDIAVPVGTNVKASLAGKVTISRFDSTYGHYIVITHSNGTKTLYAHLNERFVEAGEVVERGEIIAASGNTGNSTGPHLHFEILMGGTTRIDPLSLLPND